MHSYKSACQVRLTRTKLRLTSSLMSMRSFTGNLLKKYNIQWQRLARECDIAMRNTSSLWCIRSGAHSVDIGQNPIGHLLPVLLPILAIFPQALFLIPHLTMNEQDGEIDNIKVCESHPPALRFTLNHNSLTAQREARFLLNHISSQTRGETIRPRHDPIAEIVDVPGGAPPPRDQELTTRFCLHVLQMGDLRIIRVRPEAILFVVRAAEDIVAECLHCKHPRDTNGAQVDGVDS